MKDQTAKTNTRKKRRKKRTDSESSAANKQAESVSSVRLLREVRHLTITVNGKSHVIDLVKELRLTKGDTESEILRLVERRAFFGALMSDTRLTWRRADIECSELVADRSHAWRDHLERRRNKAGLDARYLSGEEVRQAVDRDVDVQDKRLQVEELRHAYDMARMIYNVLGDKMSAILTVSATDRDERRMV